MNPSIANAEIAQVPAHGLSVRCSVRGRAPSKAGVKNRLGGRKIGPVLKKRFQIGMRDIVHLKSI